MSSRESNWNFIPRSTFSTPGFAAETVRTLHGAWKVLRKQVRSLLDKSETGPDLDRPNEVPSSLLAEVEIETAATSLVELLANGRDSAAPRGQPCIVIGPPGVQVAQIVSAVARKEGWLELEAPDRRDLLDDAGELETALEDLGRSSDTPRVLPRLEAWFLRRERAIPGLRSLLRTLATGSGPALIGCDSWTWAFLDRTLGIEAALGEPLVLAPFDGSALDEWLGAPFRSGEFICMRAGSRDQIFAAETKEDSKHHPLLDELASAARGNPGVALAVWRRSLREGDIRGGEEERTSDARERSWWTVPPDEAELEFPATTDDIDRFVLHAVLIHGGLDPDLACEGLPFPDDEVAQRFDRLISVGALTENPLGLSVSEAAYIQVRRSLAMRGFMVDGL